MKMTIKIIDLGDSDPWVCFVSTSNGRSIGILATIGHMSVCICGNTPYRELYPHRVGCHPEQSSIASVQRRSNNLSRREGELREVVKRDGWIGWDWVLMKESKRIAMDG